MTAEISHRMQAQIEADYQRAASEPHYMPHILKTAVEDTILALDEGRIRVAEKSGDQWQVNQWVKKAVLLFFKIEQNRLIKGGHTQYFDKIANKFSDFSATQFEQAQVRIVPPATVRQGCYVAPNTVLMPCFVNIGAYIDSGTMVDTWATVGSCAQIGKNVHLSGGVGIGGVLEPLQAQPTIIEDNCFIGARSEVVEGVIVKRNSVLSMGVYLSQSTPIYDRSTKTISYGVVPEGSVVIPGNLPSKDGDYSRYAAIIVKQVDDRTRSKVSINTLLRDAGISGS